MEHTKETIYYATKAPSGHNTQPWKFKVRENSIEIHPDFEYSLPVVDPNNRELYISLGCATENLLVAATAFGYSAERSIQKSVEEDYFIRIDFRKSDNVRDETILETIEKRQTNRSVYNKKTVAENLLNQLKALPTEDSIQAYYFEYGSKDFDTVKEYIEKGNEIQMSDPSFKEELLSWIRFNANHVKSTNNGLSYKVMGSPPTPKFIGKAIVGLFLTPKKQNRSDVEKIASSSHFLVLTTKNDTTEEWIRTGIYLERLLLKLTELGVANAYLNPPCEIETLADGLSKELPINNEFPTLILRMGYAKTVPFSPRKKVEKVIVD